MSAGNGKAGITVVGVEARDFHRIKMARATLLPGQGLVRVTGKNKAGKTSLLRAIRAALGGAGEVRAEAINEASEDGTGSVRLELSNGFRIGRKFTPANPKGYLTVEGPDGGKHAQAKLSEWLGPLSFDPLAFFGLSPARQREILLSIGGDPGLPGKLDAIRKARAKKYEERTPWIAQKRRAAQVAKPTGERPSPVDVSAELRRMGELQRIERERTDLIRGHERAQEQAAQAWQERLAAAGRAVEEAERVLTDAKALAKDAASEVARLRDELRKAEVAEKAADATVVEATQAANDAQASRDQIVAQEAITRAAPAPAPDLPADPAEEMDAVRERINAADSVRASIEPWNAWEKAQKELEEATAAEQGITAEMSTFDAQERSLIADAGIPVPGLSFGPDGAPILNGHALEVASGAERCRLAVAVAMAANPLLRICMLDEEANGLDLDGLKELDALAREHGFQVWAARIGLEGGGEIEVVDGIAGDWSDEEREEAEAAAGSARGA